MSTHEEYEVASQDAAMALPDERNSSPSAKHKGGNGENANVADFELQLPESEGIEEIDPEDFVLSQDFDETEGVDEIVSVVNYGRFRGQNTFFRIRPEPDYRMAVGVLEYTTIPGARPETYLVHPTVANQIPESIRRVMLYVAISRHREVRLFPVNMPSIRGSGGESWRQSLQIAVEAAMEKWVKVVSDHGQKVYRIYHASGIGIDPAWPKLTFAQLLNLCFGDRVIRDADHPIVRQILGFE
jgi:hypothetical protein